ncbi:unnamed protein product [Didymodactylos carnosus]|uniref:Caspase family p20 domain-containing protein n=1 Tax=Didymodactylos carnosus TaxID=1234261 RepID=A0A815M895_9BILA|nr:unnamed protein product [Didymodactylos carnosus]CAF1413000.1 unnamed protein product [Didymodactylos carnosus]CAF3987528.1 unnamed protein product [Didymodactylos carnosus]CAF4300518.1 unnamed protein product [Didymodactylos carnosus]
MASVDSDSRSGAKLDSRSHAKLALVIGNNSYSKHPLTNCVNDATDLSDTLRKIGFDVELGIDCNYQKMTQLVEAFADRINDQDLVLFYFSGHGVQWQEQNYLLPVDADEKVKKEIDLKWSAISAQRTVELFSSQTFYVTVFILDCCRKYLVENQLKFRDFQGGAGLHLMKAPGGSLIQFACDAGALASDGCGITDRNGLYTKHLLQHIATPNKELDKIFSAAAAGVYRESNRKQQPFRVSSIMVDEPIYLHTENKIIYENLGDSLPTMKPETVREVVAVLVSSQSTFFLSS